MATLDQNGDFVDRSVTTMPVGTGQASVVVALLLLGANGAMACERLAPESHAIDLGEQQVDREAPGKVIAVLTELEPGDGPWCKGDAYAAIRIERAEDNRSDLADLGFTVTVVSGQLPERSYRPQYPVLSRSGHLSLLWLVGRESRIPPIDFTIVITATDSAGNEGPASEPIRIQHGSLDN